MPADLASMQPMSGEKILPADRRRRETIKMVQQIPKGYFAKNIDAVGYHDLNGKPAFKLAMQEKNHRWFLYVAHLWHRGWSVLDSHHRCSCNLSA